MSKPLALVVDDDPNVNEAFALALEMVGCEVERITDPREVIARLAARRPAIVTLDMQMPHISGGELLREIRADGRFDGLRIMVVTATPQHVQERGLYDLADVVLIKPVRLHQITELAKRFIDSDTSAV